MHTWDAYQLSEALLRPLLLCVQPRIELILLTLLLLQIRLVLEPFEDLVGQLAMHHPQDATKLLTSSSCGDAIGLLVSSCVMLGVAQKP